MRCSLAGSSPALGTIRLMPTPTRMVHPRLNGPQERPTYASAAETRQLLDRSAGARAERLRAADMVSVAEAAKTRGVAPATVRLWIEQGRAIALPAPRNVLRLPRWQFDPVIWDALPQLSEALTSTGPWRLLSFLETPLGGLEGLTPRQSIEQGGLQRVLALAAEEA